MKNTEDLKISEILDKIVQFLKISKISYIKTTKDGRINSSLNEDQIIEILQQFFIKQKWKYTLINTKIRNWYDFAIGKKDDDNFFIPVNIKVTELATDNLNCKLGIYFALTGLLPTNDNESNWKDFFKLLSQNINTRKDRDYYFLIANKKDNLDFFWTELKSLQKLTSNGNNLPFQANWKENRERVKRTHEEAGEFILSVFKESVYKRAKIKDEFNLFMEQHLQEYKKHNIEQKK